MIYQIIEAHVKLAVWSASTVMDHLMYADDCVIFSPSSAGIQQLLNVCSVYGEQHDI